MTNSSAVYCVPKASTPDPISTIASLHGRLFVLSLHHSLMDHLPFLTEHITKSIDSLSFVIDDLRHSLPHCRGPLTSSMLLLTKDLKAACKLRSRLEQHLAAITDPHH